MERTYKTMKVRAETLDLLRKLYKETGLPMITIVEMLVKAEYDRKIKYNVLKEVTSSLSP